MIYAGYHIVMESGRYVVYAAYDETYEMYVKRWGSFNTQAQAKSWIRELRRVARLQGALATTKEKS